MSKEKTLPASSFLSEMFQVGIYKRNQGRITRQITFATVALTTGIGAWRLLDTKLSEKWFDWTGFLPPGTGLYFFPSLLLIAGLWFGFRIVNLPQFADFLIAVEAEMNKVSWPSRGELIRSSIVVICVIILLAGVLFGFDMLWKAVFTYLPGFRILYSGG